MIDGLKPYPAMKDSGVPWLWEVPEHWEVRPVGGIGSLFKGNGGNKGDEVPAGIPCVRYGDLYTRHEFFITKSKSYVSKERAGAYTPIHYGDILFAASGETDEDIGRSSVNLIEGEARCGGDVLVLRPEIPAVPRYLGYAADSPASRWQKASMGRGFTVVHIYGSQLKRLQLPLPSLPEQAAIVRFLDHADRRIRRYIRAKQKLIKLLEEQKQAIIHRAVKRGLDPNVRLKPSGVEWLGDVPEHWELMRVKQVTQVLRGKFTHRPRNDPSLYDGQYPFIQTGEVARAGKSITSFRQTLNQRGLAVSKLFPAGTLVMTIAANIGDVAILDFEACFPDSVVGFVTRARVERDFLYYLFVAMKPELLREAPVNTQGNLNVDRIGARAIALPPEVEQQAIVRWIEASCASLTGAVEKAGREVSLLREYRTRLIADVVTGKLDVREAAARLPQEAEDVEPLDEAEGDAEQSDAGDGDGAPEEVET